MNRLQAGKRKEMRLQRPNLSNKKPETEAGKRRSDEGGERFLDSMLPKGETQKRLNSQLLLAAQDGRYNEIKILLETGADVEARNPSGTTPLIVAVKHGYSEVCALLIGWKANVNAKSNSGATALMRAAWFGHTKICALLIEKGADIGARDTVNGYIAAEAALKRDTAAFLKFAAYVDSSMGKGSFRMFLSDVRECVS
jgi:ankyrin repeat protein